MTNDMDQKTADWGMGEQSAGQARQQARIRELKGKGYPTWWAESQALSEVGIQAGGWED